MNKKYNSYDHLSKLKCVENLEIIGIEKKFEFFSVENDYDYGVNILDEKQCLPKINIDLSKLISFYKDNKNSSVDDLVKEMSTFNQYFADLTLSVDLTKCESLREKSIVYYLYYLMNRGFFYVCMHNNFMASKPTSKIFQTFFNNFLLITNCAKLYLENDIENSSMLLEEENKMNSEMIKKINSKIYNSFSELKKYPNEFKEFIMHCHNFLSLLLFSIDQFTIIDDKEVSHIDEEIYSLFQTFVMSFNIIYEVNEFYSIVDNEVFYNEGISKDLNLRRDFKMFLKNERIKRKQKKEGKKTNEKMNTLNKKMEEAKEKNKIEIDDDMNSEEEEEEENEKNENKEDKNKIEFTLFDYMWLFNTSAKNEIIRLFNGRKQRSEFFKSLQRRRNPNDQLNIIDIFLNSNKFNLQLNIRRDHLIEDALNELEKNRQNLQNELKVKFVGEQGVDQGGVRKEFFILVIRQIFDPNYGMFSYNNKTRFFWFNHYSFESKIKYELIGTIFGLAIYNNTILDVKLPISIYKKLLGIKPTFEDLKECDEELYKNLSYILNNNDPKLEEELDSNFTVVDDKFGEKIEIPLKPGGEKILINNSNKEEYVELFINWYFNTSIDDYFRSFEKGFYKVFSKNLTKILTPKELELILCGTQILDFHELKIAAAYEEYDKNSETIKFFWEILFDFNEEEKKKFLSFVTGCDRAPIDGLGSLPITITNGGNDLNQLPTAHTCFNNLILPDYKNKEKLKKSLLTAINYSEGFGLI